MNMIESLLFFLKGNGNTIETPEDMCPNCWGHEKYEGSFRKALGERKIDLLNLEANKGWIQAYVAKNFEGIQFPSNDPKSGCPSCNRDKD